MQCVRRLHVNADKYNFRTEKKPTGKKTASRGRSRQRKTKKAKSETEEEDDDEDGLHFIVK